MVTAQSLHYDIFPSSSSLFFGGHAGRLIDGLHPISALWRTPDATLFAIVRDRNDSILIHRSGSWFRTPHVGPDPYGFGPFVFHRGTMWLGGQTLVRDTAAALLQFRHRVWQPIPQVPFEDVTAFAVDGDDILWVGTFQGLWRLREGREWDAVPLPGEGQQVSALFHDGKGSLWVAETGPHMAPRPLHRRFDATGQWETLPLPPRVRTFRGIQALLCEPSGALWMGSALYGLHRYADGKWTRFTGLSTDLTKPILQGQGIAALVIDRRGRIWAAASAGVWVYQGRMWRKAVILLTQGAESSGDLIWSPTYCPYSLHLDADERLWIGTMDAQLAWIDTAASDVPATYDVNQLPLFKSACCVTIDTLAEE